MLQQNEKKESDLLQPNKMASKFGKTSNNGGESVQNESASSKDKTKDVNNSKLRRKSLTKDLILSRRISVTKKTSVKRLDQVSQKSNESFDTAKSRKNSFSQPFILSNIETIHEEEQEHDQTPNRLFVKKKA